MKKYSLLVFIFYLSVVTNYCAGQNDELWGMTTGGGANNSGVIFKIQEDGTGYTLVHSMDTNAGSTAGLIEATNHILYGVTVSGGVFSSGTLFSLNPSDYSFTKLVDFNHSAGTGSIFMGTLLQATNGKLYGTSWETAFNYNIQSDTLEVFHYFNSYDSWLPYENSMIEGLNGILYGMSTYGGINGNFSEPGYGTIFKVDPNSDVFQKIYDFDSLNGKRPYGGFCRLSDGNLYGLTALGGQQNMGVLFKFNPDSNVFTKLYDFDLPNGARPYGTLLNPGNDTLYGTTFWGGLNNMGVIFKFNPMNNTYTKLYDFDSTNGKWAYGAMIQGSNGKLFGMTSKGGNYDDGVIYCFDPLSNNFLKIFDFDSINGQNPYAALLRISGPTNTSLVLKGHNFQIYPNPTTSLLRIEISQNIEHIELFNLFGKQVYSWHTDVSGVTGKKETVIDLTNFSAGIYFLQASDGEKVWRGKVVKE